MLAIGAVDILIDIVLFLILAGLFSYSVFRLCRSFGVMDLIYKKRADHDFRYVFVPKTVFFRLRKPYICPENLQDYIGEMILFPKETLLAVLPVIPIPGRSILTRNLELYGGCGGALLILSDHNLRLVSHDLRQPKGARAIGLEYISGVDMNPFTANRPSFSEAYMQIFYYDGSNDDFQYVYRNPQAFIDTMNAAIYRTNIRRTVSIADELEELERLRGGGVITEADYEGALSMLIGRPASKARELCAQLAVLHDLFRAGVLSESEFNLKKWDILSRP